jgi:hypothetical protein
LDRQDLAKIAADSEKCKKKEVWKLTSSDYATDFVSGQYQNEVKRFKLMIAQQGLKIK